MKLTKEQEKWTIERLEELIASNNNEQGAGGLRKAADLVGISSSVLSQLRKGTYGGQSEAKMIILNNYFLTKDEAATLATVDRKYKATSISEDICSYLRYCQLEGGIMSLTGDAGIGKTMAIRKYVSEHRDSTIHITMKNGYTNLKVILSLIASKLGLPTKGGIYAMCEALTVKLRDGMLVIIDEAQHCSLKQIDLLRSFCDEFEAVGQSLGICFVGNRLTANKFGASVDSELGQISSRAIANKYYSSKDVTKEDIQKLFSDVSDDGICIDFLYGLSQGVQGIRGAVGAYRTAVRNGNISYEGILAAAKHRAAR